MINGIPIFRTVRNAIRNSMDNWTGQRAVYFIRDKDGEFMIEWDPKGKITYRGDKDVAKKLLKADGYRSDCHCCASEARCQRESRRAVRQGRWPRYGV